jgi:sorting nexin-1/2
MATAAGEFSQATSELASSDVGKQVAHSLSGLAEVERRSQELQTAQSEQDMVTLMGTGE